MFLSAPTRRHTDVALLEANDTGLLKQLTTMTYVAARPATVKPQPDGGLWHQTRADALTRP